MALYLLSVFIPLLASRLNNKIVVYYILFLLLLFLCFGYMTGSDWRNYELSYNSSKFSTLLDERFEIGYAMLQAAGHFLSIDFWHFHIAIKVVCFILLSRMIMYLNINILLFWALFLPEMGFFLFIDCPFRNLISLGIFSLALPALFNRQKKQYFFIITIAVLFHYSALLLYILYFIPKFRIRNGYYIIIFLIVNVFAYKIDFIVGTILVGLFDASDFLRERLLLYALDENYQANAINIGTLYRTFFFVLFIIFRSKIEEKSEFSKILFRLSMFFFLLYPFTISLKIFSRFTIYLMPFYLSTVILLLETFKPVLKCTIFLILFFWTFVKTYSVVTEDYRYIPYTNYFLYFFQEKLDYNYRSTYNFLNSSYGDN